MSPRPHRVLLTVWLLGLGASRLPAQAPPITAVRIGRIVGVLADDSMLGRATPSPQLEAAAAYVAAAFRRAALRPAGDSGGFVQRYAVAGDTTAPNVVALLPGSDRKA